MRTLPPPLQTSGLVAAVALLLLAWEGPTRLDAQVSPPSDPVEEWIYVETASVGVDLESSEPLALLHTGWERVLPLWIGEVEAVAIARGLQGASLPRPLTHDLFVGVLSALGGQLEEIRVTAIQQATYLGVLRIRTANGLREVDARPSDALALAVRTGARLAVAAHLLDDLQELEFLSADGDRPVVRIRGLTVGEGPGTPALRSGRGAAPAGVLVLHVAPELVARGLAPGDVVTQVGATATPEPLDFLEAIQSLAEEGNPITVLRVREGVSETISLPPRRGPTRTGALRGEGTREFG